MEIWESGVKMGLDKKLGSIGTTPWNTIAAMLYTNIKEDSKICLAQKKPMRSYLKGKNPNLFDKALQDSKNTAKENAKIIKAKQTKENIKERSLHPLLVKFLYENPNFNLYCKTIFHEKSIKSISGRDKWNYPDIVGVHFLV